MKTSFKGRGARAVMENERERNQDLIPFKGVSFKARFEGREGSAVTESERKRIPGLCGTGAEGTTTMLFSFEGEGAKSSIR